MPRAFGAAEDEGRETARQGNVPSRRHFARPQQNCQAAANGTQAPAFILVRVRSLRERLGCSCRFPPQTALA